MLNRYLVESKKILNPLLKVFTGDEHYKPWVRYFDVAHKAAGDYSNNDDNDGDDDAFATAMDTLVEEVLLPSVGGKTSNVDWRVVKKILNIKQIFQKNPLLEIDPASLLKPLKAKLQEALDYLIWKDQNDCTILTRKTIERLLSILDDESQTEKVKDAIISGRFDRNQFELGKIALFWAKMEECIYYSTEWRVLRERYLKMKLVNNICRTRLKRRRVAKPCQHQEGNGRQD